MTISLKALIQESADVTKKLTAYHKGGTELSFRQFSQVLQQAKDLCSELDNAIDVNSKSQAALLQVREKLDGALSSDSLAYDDPEKDFMDGKMSDNPFGMFSGNTFGSSVSTRESVHVDDFHFSQPDS